MKIHCSQLCCPRCGATEFHLLDVDIFLCDFCNKKFNFDVNNIDFSNETTVFRGELREQLEKEAEEIKNKILISRRLLNKYIGLANPNKFKIFSYICLIVSIMLIFSMSFIGLISTTISIILCICAINRAKSKKEKYQPLANYYAKKIVEHNKVLDFYATIISKLID